MDTYYYKGPFGSHFGKKAEILRLAELTPTEDTISKDGKTWVSLQSLFPSDYQNGCYWYYGGGSHTSFWVEKEKFVRSPSNRFDYIGPRFCSQRLRIEEIIEEISLFPQALHLVSPKESPIWEKWNEVPELYQMVIAEYPNINVAFEVDSRLRQHHLFHDPNWDRLIPQLSECKDFSKYMFKEHRIGESQTFLKQNSLIPYLRMILQLICLEMVQTLSEEGSFQWPHIGRFTRKKYKNQKIYSKEQGSTLLLDEHFRISFRSSSSLRKWLKTSHIYSKNIPGDKTPTSSVKYWKNLDSSQISRGRNFGRKIALRTDIPLEQVHGAICFINHLIYLHLYHNHTIFIPSIGTLYLSHRNRKMVLRYKPVKNKNDKFNIRGKIEV